jgi:serine/threonine protein kinase
MPEPLAVAVNKVDSDADEHDYPMIGETLGLWRLVRGLGRGGMGEVYEAEYDYLYLLSLSYAADQRELIRQELRTLSREEQARLAGEMLGTPLPPNARFAIKVCNARIGTPGHKRFLQEAEVAQRLGDHPYIVTVHAVNGGNTLTSGAGRFELERGKHKDVAFMVMDLAARDYDHTKVSIAEAVHVVRCIATALDHAHSNGIIHRDLKPENILGSIQHPLLTDFGIAKELDQTHGLTRTGQIIGTLDYMSPEQATDAKRVDHRSDIYSLGVVLYEYATQGSLPYFHKMDRESCLAAIRSERVEPRWPREYQDNFPVGLERIILKAMAHSMDDRYQAMSEFITDLDRWSRHDWIPFWGRVRMHAWVRHELRRHPRIIWGAGGGILASALLTLAILLPGWLDHNRRELDQELNDFEKIVRRIEDGKESQPSRDDIAKIKTLDQRLEWFGKDRYTEQQLRRNELERRLRSRRWLMAQFASDSRATIRNEDAHAAMEQLRLATGDGAQYWNLVPDGLFIQEPIEKLTLGPYGTGVTCCMIRIRTRDGFQLRIHELNGQPTHVTTWRVQNQQLQLVYREDEKPLVTLRPPEALPVDQEFVQLDIALEVTGNRIRSWSKRAGLEHKYVGINPGSAAMVELDLPKKSVLMLLEIRPEGPP